MSHLVFYPLFRPIRMLAAKERGFVPAAGPIQPPRRAPALFRRHAAVNGKLFRTGLFVCKHDGNMLPKT